MEVPVTAFRAQLRTWLERVRHGDEIVVTDHGVPVARLIPVGTQPALERLTAEGVIGKPAKAKRLQARGLDRVRATGSVSDEVGKQRR